MAIGHFLASNKRFFGASVLTLGLFGLMLGPVFAWGKADSIFVDKDNKGSEDGSRNHPYRSIDKALKKAGKGDTVFVGKGRYKTNITIPKDVRLVGGKSKSDVVIEGDDDKPTVTMKEDSEIQKVTIKGGRHGIRVEDGADARVVEVVIKDSVRDGIHIDRGTTDKKDEVFIEKTEIKDNRLAGIFSEKRSVIVMDSEIVRNGDGLDFTAGVKAWVKDTKLTDNRGSGLKLTLDGAKFWSRDLSIRRNGREGVEVNSYGGLGDIGFKKTKIMHNGRYGIAKVARGRGAESALNRVYLDETHLEGNRLGSVSRPLWIQ